MIKRRAFTLIELIIVVAIIIIIGATAPMLSSGIIVERQVYNAATQIQQDILLIQNLAITHGSGGPSISGGTRFVMRLYLSSNTIAYQTKENAPNLPSSNPVPGDSIVVRKMPSSIGFPAYFGKTSPESVKIGSNNVTSGYVDLAFDNQGYPYWSVNSGPYNQNMGYIILVNSSLSKQIKVEVTQIGRVTIDWVP